jgi:hypothetical protein
VKLAGVRRQIEEAKAALSESVEHAGRGEHDPAYRAALTARNQVFHAVRGLAAARAEALPEMPVVGVSGTGGGLDDPPAILQALDAALGVDDDAADMPAHLEAARVPLARYLGWLRDEVARHLREKQPPH